MSSGSRTMIGYTVEVRTSYHMPTIHNGVAVDREWRQLQFQRGKDGVPAGYFDAHLNERDLFGFTQANALRWLWLAHANAESVTGSTCIETRLVEHRLIETHNTERLEPQEALDARGHHIDAGARK